VNNRDLDEAFKRLSTPLLFDACLRLSLPVRVSSAGLRPLIPRMKIAGRVLPARHYGSVDVFLEAMESGAAGDVLVIDNGGRLDEACIGDLTVLESRLAGLSGLVVWGVHRDTPELLEIGFPVFSLGACPMGPMRLEPREPTALTSVRFEGFTAGREDAVFADDDGVLFAPMEAASALLAAAGKIQAKERAQADAIRGGRGLREQLAFSDYLRKRASDPDRTFRKHLREMGGAIEE
jgi:4-hydroxy-4-methyl-2-oxoglutarate aldolase